MAPWFGALEQVTLQDEMDMAMRVQWIRGMGVLSWLMVSVATVQANDIVDFFRAVNRHSPISVEMKQPIR